MTISQLAAAIAAAEGPQGMAAKTNNPGNLTVGTGNFSGVVGTNGNFLAFDSSTSGQAALEQYLENGLSEVGSGTGAYGSLTPNNTLADFLNIYADNPGSGYISSAASTLGVSPSLTLGQLQATLQPSAAAADYTSALDDSGAITLSSDSAGVDPLVVGGVALAGVLVAALLFREVRAVA